MIDEAVKHYHSLLAGELAADAMARLVTGTQRDGLHFGDRMICTVLRPLFISARQLAEITRGSTFVLTAIEKLGRALLADGELRASLELTPEEEAIIAIEPGYGAPDASGRLDAFLNSRGGFSFVEYNADSPGGLLYGDALGEIFMEMAIVKEFAQRFPVSRLKVRPRLLETLLSCYRDWGGRESPRIAIVDWREVKTRAEFELCREYFTAQGYPTLIVDPSDLTYEGGRLRAGDEEIDLVYKRVIIGELLARGGIDHPLFRAARERSVCVVNSFRVQLLFRKSIFALLDDPAQEHLFTPEEVAALRLHVPWTRRLRAGASSYRGRQIDLLEFVAANRDRLVLKPDGDYGGRGIRLGWECGDRQWNQAIDDALGASFVVQERVEVRQVNFPSLLDGQIHYVDRYVDFDPYTWRGGTVEGAGIRLSSSNVLNVASGGGSAVPLMIIDEDHTP
jgi:hypothetical protein